MWKLGWEECFDFIFRKTLIIRIRQEAKQTFGGSGKICKYQYEDVWGMLHYSQQEAEHEKINHHDLFYKTDYYWKAETGLWAVGIMAEFLNDE